MTNMIRCFSCFLITAALIGSTPVLGDEIIPVADTDTPAHLPGETTGITPPDTHTGKINVIFDVTPRQENKKLFFDITTNLPDGMVFMTAIRDIMGNVHRMNGTIARVRMELIQGKTTLGPFPLFDKPFPPGEYRLYINSYPDEDQPENVIRIIGKEGANLTGDTIISGMVFFCQTFMITG